MYTGAVKAGKLCNGFERGKGSIVHIIDLKNAGGYGYSLCNETPKIAWSERALATATCQRCLKLFRIESTVKSLINTLATAQIGE